MLSDSVVLDIYCLVCQCSAYASCEGSRETAQTHLRCSNIRQVKFAHSIGD